MAVGEGCSLLNDVEVVSTFTQVEMRLVVA
jgi:hypothetical protein